jgi:phospholipid/cholesterol/gamma-HCH transport system substrate-binding protein
MPVSSKPKWSQLKVGLMAVAALLILFYLIFLMSGTLGFFKSKTLIYTYLSDSAAIAPSSEVRLNGILIGKVAKVALSGLDAPNRAVKVDLEIENKFLPSIPVDSQAGIAAPNLLGIKYINITRGKQRETVTAGSEIASAVTPEIEEFLKQGSSTLEAMQSLVLRASKIIEDVESGKGTIGKVLVDDAFYTKALKLEDTFQKIADDAHEISSNLNTDTNSIGKVLHDNNELYGEFRDGLAKVNTLIDGINNGEGSLGKFAKDPAMYDEFHQLLLDSRKLLAGIQAGEGTLGKWLVKDDLHDQVQTTLGRVDALLDKMNNGPGVIGQLLNDPRLAEDLDGLMRDTQGLLKDFRANPKKFLHIKIGLF